jgi:ABC-2 type transport system ATP-binding protein
MRAWAASATPILDTVVDLKHVSKAYRRGLRSAHLRDVLSNLLHPQVVAVQALCDVDLQIGRGEIVAYAGPNGAGKSTTVKLLASALSPDTGMVRVLGMDPVRERVRYVSHIGVVFGQRTELWWDHPVAATFEWKRVVWDIPDERYRRMLGLVRELLGMDEFFNAPARELSLGQRMRADLGLALLHEPEILFLDEPTIGLDVLAKRNILRFLRELNRERQVTVLLTSHDMTELEQLASRIVLIDHGRIAYDGDWAQLRRMFVDRRELAIETSLEAAPQLSGAELVHSEGGRHAYRFDAAQTTVAALLAQASAQTEVLDVETHRAPIDDVIADIYEKWQRQRSPL